MALKQRNSKTTHDSRPRVLVLGPVARHPDDCRILLHAGKSLYTYLRINGGYMTKRLLTVPAVLIAISLAAPDIGHAQTFKVEKFDIKADGGTDYVAVEAATGRVFVSRATHMMVVEGDTGKVLGDIANTPGVHGAGIE